MRESEKKENTQNLGGLTGQTDHYSGSIGVEQLKEMKEVDIRTVAKST